MFLRKAGYSAVSAWNGEAALSLLLTGDLVPAVILLDLVMPIMDGWRFREIQASHSKLWHIPVIAMADAPMNDDYVRVFRPAGVLVKPFDWSELMKAVATAVSKTAILSRPAL
jgi:DNA-binding response OmpR family regulator